MSRVKRDLTTLNTLHQITGKINHTHLKMQNVKKYPKSKNSQIPKLKVSVANRKEFSDYDYLDKLNPSELEWLKKFHQEYNQADISIEKPFHATKKLKKDCYDKNNARNRCLFARFKGANQLWYLNEAGYP